MCLVGSIIMCLVGSKKAQCMVVGCVRVNFRYMYLYAEAAAAVVAAAAANSYTYVGSRSLQV